MCCGALRLDTLYCLLQGRPHRQYRCRRGACAAASGGRAPRGAAASTRGTWSRCRASRCTQSLDLGIGTAVQCFKSSLQGVSFSLPNQFIKVRRAIRTKITGNLVYMIIRLVMSWFSWLFITHINAQAVADLTLLEYTLHIHIIYVHM